MVTPHELIQLIHLRENGCDSVKYIKKSFQIIPVLQESSSEQRFLEFQPDSTQCALCNNDFMEGILRLVENYYLCTH